MRVEGSEDRIRVVEEGVVVDVREGRDLRQEMAYDNHHSVNKHEEKVLNKTVGNTAGIGRRHSKPTTHVGSRDCTARWWGMVEEKIKLHIIHDLTFEGQTGEGSGEGRQRSVCTDIEWEKITVCNLGEVLYTILKRTLGLKAEIGVGLQIFIQLLCVRQMEVNPDGASAFFV